MTQTRRHSLLEATASTACGYGIAVASQVFVFPLFGIIVPLAVNLKIGGVFTVISVVRMYIFRRIFNRYTGTRRSAFNRTRLLGKRRRTF